MNTWRVRFKQYLHISLANFALIIILMSLNSCGGGRSNTETNTVSNTNYFGTNHISAPAKRHSSISVGVGGATVLQGVAYGDGRYVAVGQLGRIVYSFRTKKGEIVWRLGRNSFGSKNLSGITYGVNSKKFIAVGDNGQILSSNDGIYWYHVREGLDDIYGQSFNFKGITTSNESGNDYYLAVGSLGISYISSDGENWKEFPLPNNFSGGQLYGVAFGASVNQAVAVGQNATLFTRSGAVSWTMIDSGDPEYNLNGIAYYPDYGLFWAVGGQGYIYDSPDGENWRILDSSSTHTNQALAGISVDNESGYNVYVAVGDSGTILASSVVDHKRGHLWNLETSPTSNNLYAVTCGLDIFESNSITKMFVAVGDQGTIIYSHDAESWTQAAISYGYNGVAYHNGALVVIADEGMIYFSPDDALSWESANSNTTKSLYAVTKQQMNESDLWVAVGSNAAIVTSVDGVNWTARDSGNSSYGLNDVISRPGMYVAVGDSGHIRYSLDAVTWSDAVSPTTNNLYKVVVDLNSGIFFATGENETILQSLDGIHWQIRSSAANSDMQIEHSKVGGGDIHAATITGNSNYYHSSQQAHLPAINLATFSGKARLNSFKQLPPAEGADLVYSDGTTAGTLVTPVAGGTPLPLIVDGTNVDGTTSITADNDQNGAITVAAAAPPTNPGQEEILEITTDGAAAEIAVGMGDNAQLANGAADEPVGIDNEGDFMDEEGTVHPIEAVQINAALYQLVVTPNGLIAVGVDRILYSRDEGANWYPVTIHGVPDGETIFLTHVFYARFSGRIIATGTWNIFPFQFILQATAGDITNWGIDTIRLTGDAAVNFGNITFFAETDDGTFVTDLMGHQLELAGAGNNWNLAPQNIPMPPTGLAVTPTGRVIVGGRNTTPTGGIAPGGQLINTIDGGVTWNGPFPFTGNMRTIEHIIPTGVGEQVLAIQGADVLLITPRILNGVWTYINATPPVPTGGYNNLIAQAIDNRTGNMVVMGRPNYLWFGNVNDFAQAGAGVYRFRILGMPMVTGDFTDIAAIQRVNVVGATVTRWMITTDKGEIAYTDDLKHWYSGIIHNS